MIAGLEHVVHHHHARTAHQPRRALVSASFGGWCGDPASCAADEAILTVDLLVTTHHIPVVVAAGNDQADACSITPAASHHAITVGATDRHDSTRCVEGGGGNITAAITHPPP